MKNSLSVFVLMGCILIASSCKREFDSPPDTSTVDPNLTATKTIAQIKAMHTFGSVEAFTDDDIIEGVVVADDKSGNYYKQISIQDASAGITIRLDGLSLYANYPVGRKLFIKLKGLYLGDYAGLIQIGGSINNADPTALNVNALASDLFDTYIVKGSINNAVTPTVVTVADLNDNYQSMLIQLNDAEFIPADTSKTYANATTQTSANVTVKPCGGSNIIIRTSGYANFAGINVPNGNGTLLAIYTRFNNTKQLIVRDTSDVQFTGARCGGGTTTPGTAISLAQLRALYTGTDRALDKGYTVGGTVISDVSNKNVSNGNVVIQSGDAGIVVYLGGTLTYALGDSIVFNLSTADSLIKYNGSLELKTAFGFTPPTPVATGKTVTPKVKTIGEINTALATPLGSATNFEYTLLTVKDAAVPAGTYSGNKTLTDASGNIILYTRTAATFAGTTMPTGNQNWTGYAFGYNATNEFQIRSTADVTGGGTTTPPTGNNLLAEDFETVTTTGSTPVALTGWKNIGETGSVQYLGKTFSSNKYAQITAFNSNAASQQATVKSWLITPPVNLNNTTNEVLSFKTNDGYNNGATLKVYYSTNYDGGNTPSSATWTEFTGYTVSSGNTSGYGAAFVNSGDISLSSINGTAVYVAFVYEGGYNPSQKTTTFQVDDVKITGN